MLGETDEWAHGRKYDLYLDAAWRNDRFVRQLWETAQACPSTRTERRSSSRPTTVAAKPARTGPATAGRFPAPIGSGWPSWVPACPPSACAPSVESHAVTDRGDHRLAARRGFQQGRTEGGAAAPAAGNRDVAPVARAAAAASSYAQLKLRATGDQILRPLSLSETPPTVAARRDRSSRPRSEIHPSNPTPARMRKIAS